MSNLIAKCCILSVALVAVMGIAVTEAQAQAQNENDDTLGMLEFKLGPYMPGIDEEFDGDGPYQEFFDNRSMLYGEAGVYYHMWQGVGKLSVGINAGYGRVSGAAVDGNGEVIDSQERGAFRIIPLRSSVTYRYDYSAHNHGIPFVPFVKAGLNYYLWRALDPGGDTSQVEDFAGSGGTMGWHATLGLNFHLDFLDPRSSAAFGMNWGIENSYLFVDYTFSRVGVFSDDGFNLSDNHWSAGLAFEF